MHAPQTLTATRGAAVIPADWDDAIRVQNTLAALSRASGERTYTYKLPLPERLYPPTGLMFLPLPVGSQITEAKLVKVERGSQVGARRPGALALQVGFPKLNVPGVQQIKFAVVQANLTPTFTGHTWIGQFGWSGNTYLCFAFNEA